MQSPSIYFLPVTLYADLPSLSTLVSKQLYKSLIEFDPIREKYWLFRAGECEAKAM